MKIVGILLLISYTGFLPWVPLARAFATGFKSPSALTPTLIPANLPDLRTTEKDLVGDTIFPFGSEWTTVNTTGK